MRRRPPRCMIRRRCRSRRSGRRRFSRHAAPSTARAASLSASRSSTVPLLPISPAVRSHSPTRWPSAACSRDVPPRPIRCRRGAGRMRAGRPEHESSSLQPNTSSALSGCREPQRARMRRARKAPVTVSLEPPKREQVMRDSCDAARCTAGRPRFRRTAISSRTPAAMPEISGYIIDSSYINCPCAARSPAASSCCAGDSSRSAPHQQASSSVHRSGGAVSACRAW